MKECREWLNPQELREEFGFSIPTQDRYRKEKAIPYSKVGRNIRYSRTKIHEWLQNHAITEGD